jgi:hypothetical protein
VDGNYSLAFHGPATALLFAGSGLAAQSQTDSLFRFYGDMTGDRIVDQQDLGLFRTTYNLSSASSGYISALDANGDGIVDQVDLGQFRIRFNLNLF